MELKVHLIPSLIATILLLLPLMLASETPEYTIIYSGMDFEVRYYENMTWMSTPSSELSFELATSQGFHRLFEYSTRANLNNSYFMLGTPILTSIVTRAGPLLSSAYLVSMYLPSKFQVSPPIPISELDLQVTMWPNHCIAVRSFVGFAQDGNVVDEVKKLDESLSGSPWANSTNPRSKYAYSVAQYNLPFQFFNRRNDIWIDVTCTELLASRSRNLDVA